MAITNIWRVVQMDTYPEHEGEENLVFTVHWAVNGTDGTYVGSAYGSVSISANTSNSFTAYANLTESQVVGWVKEALGDEQVAAYEASIAQQIEDQVNPSIVAPPLPWA